MHGALARRVTTKIHALVDANGLPITLKITEGQAHDGRSARTCSPPRPRRISCADRAYDSDELRRSPPAGEPGRTSSPCPTDEGPAFSAFLYRYRNLVERFFSKLKHFRAVATRFEKHAANYLALVNWPHHESGCGL